jgi:heparosan-N-sulfate-glucuronate 5-epimerase
MGTKHGASTAMLQFFSDKIQDYWHILYPLIPLKELRKDEFLYFYDISGKATQYTGNFSKDGIYLFAGYDGNDHLFPLEIAQYSLACWVAKAKTGDDSWIQKALLHCDWLIDHQHNDGSWRMDHKNPLYADLPDSWPSSLCQGLGISSLLRAYKYTGKPRYLEAARTACRFFSLDVKDGGVYREFPLGFILEEYPRPQLNGVLNGYISALLGIFELSEIDSDFKNVCKTHFENLKKIMPLYDTGYWSYYSLDSNIASGFYHRYVIIQLNALGSIDSYFDYFAQKFTKYTQFFLFPAIALLGKVFFKIKEKSFRNA